MNSSKPQAQRFRSRPPARSSARERRPKRCGCAPRTPYRSNLVHYNWRFFKGYGTGDLPNNGLHFVDIARWALGAEWPERIYAGGGHYFCEGEDWNWDDTHMLTVQFPDRKVHFPKHLRTKKKWGFPLAHRYLIC